MSLAFIPSSFAELWLVVGIIVVGWFLVLLGNVVFGWKTEGGKRLIVFLAGCGAAVLAVFLCQHFSAAFASQEYPSALGFYLGVVFLVFGASFMGASVFCSNETVRSYFDAVIRSI